MLGPVGRIAEGLRAAGELAGVRLLPRVRPQVGLEILQSGVRFGAIFELQRTTTVGCVQTVAARKM